MKQVRKAGGGPRVFYAGVKTAAMFGCECFAMPQSSVDKLRTWAAQVEFARPVGVSVDMKLMASPTNSDPGYNAAAQLIARWAMEVGS